MNMAESTGRRIETVLNRDCHCISVDAQRLRKHMAVHLAPLTLPSALQDVSQSLFADFPVFVWQGHIDKMASLVQAVERVATNDAYRQQALARIPEVARRRNASPGVFFSYDFHLGAHGPRLIEINTNAGGVLLTLYQAAAQQGCCPAITSLFGNASRFAAAEQELIAMFRNEWRHHASNTPLTRVAIVDRDPTSQHLYPEFLLFQSLFRRHGIDAVIADPSELQLRHGQLELDSRPIDLVYNRTTDFYLEEEDNLCLQQAWIDELAVVTPSPLHYALYADKRNLALLTDAQALNTLSVDKADIDVIQALVPGTVELGDANAEQLWRSRRDYFFKPATGFGSRGSYRGAKLTHRVWQDIRDSAYLAQEFVPPGERRLLIDGSEQLLKVDLRSVTYAGQIQQLSARLYQGQLTNMRTAGGGLATAFATPDFGCSIC